MDPRHATLRATIQWSYDLLSPAEQTLFARLSVFLRVTGSIGLRDGARIRRDRRCSVLAGGHL